MTEQGWENFARLNAGERFRAQSAEMGATATAELVREAHLAPGLHVLDVACGSGEPSISIATVLQGSGQVIGIDSAAGAVSVARERAERHELKNIQFLEADVHSLHFANESFDRVTSRLGVMFFQDLPHALSEMRRVLRPNGRVALLAWGAMEQPYFEMTVGTILRLRPTLEIPERAKAMFKFGVPGTLSTALMQAGFADVEERVEKLCWDWRGTPEDLWEYFSSVTIPFRPLLNQVEHDRGVNLAVLEEMRKHFDGRYVRLKAEMVLATAARG